MSSSDWRALLRGGGSQGSSPTQDKGIATKNLQMASTCLSSVKVKVGPENQIPNTSKFFVDHAM